MNVSMEFKKFHNKILVHMKTFDATIDPILVHFKGSKVGLYVSFRICLYESALDFLYNQQNSMNSCRIVLIYESIESWHNENEGLLIFCCKPACDPT